MSFECLPQQSVAISVKFDVLSHDVENGLPATVHLLIVHRLQLLHSEANPEVVKCPSYLGQSIVELVLSDLVEEVLKNALHHVRLLLIHKRISLNHVLLYLLENVREEILHDAEELFTLIVLIRDLLEPLECAG